MSDNMSHLKNFRKVDFRLPTVDECAATKVALDGIRQYGITTKLV